MTKIIFRSLNFRFATNLPNKSWPREGKHLKIPCDRDDGSLISENKNINPLLR